MANTTALANLAHLEKPDVGYRDNAWGADLNTMFDGFDDAIAGVLSKSIAASGTVTLSTAEAGHHTIILTGTLTSNTSVVVPTAQRNYRFLNSTDGAYTVTVKTSAGSGIAIRRGDWSNLSCDGTNVIRSGAGPRVIGASGGSSNAYTLTPSPALTAYDTDQAFAFRANHSNTGAATLNVSGLGAKDIKKYAAGSGTKAALAANDILSGQYVEVAYDGTDMVLASPVGNAEKAQLEPFVIACSGETTAITTGTAKVTFRMPYAFTLTAVKASLGTAQTSGSIVTVDINEAGSTILSTKLTIDNGEKTSESAAAAAVISDTALAADAEITVDIDQVGDGTAKGLKITLIGRQT